MPRSPRQHPRRCPPASCGRGRTRGDPRRPVAGPGRRRRPGELPSRSLLAGQVRYAAGELIQVKASLRADGGLQERPDLPYLQLEFAQELHRATLGTNHVTQDRTLCAPGHEGLGEGIYVDEGPTTAATLFLDGDEC